MQTRLTVDLAKIRHNTAQVVEKLADYNSVTYGVTKVLGGDPQVASAMLAGGVQGLADSRLQNIQKMRAAGIKAPILLLRSPGLSEIPAAVSLTDMGLVSDAAIITALNEQARAQHLIYQIILMVNLGEDREGIAPEKLLDLYQYATTLSYVQVVGIGTNLGCPSGKAPTKEQLDILVRLAALLPLENVLISGGTSIELPLLYEEKWEEEWLHRINHWRVGESIFFGWDIITKNLLPDFASDVCTFTAEVIEVHDQRIVVAAGSEELGAGMAYPLDPNLHVTSISSDHLVVVSKSSHKIYVGDFVEFSLTYESLLAIANSPYVNIMFK